MVDPAWVLSLMLRAEPAASSSPWRATYETTAAAIARAATAAPLFSGRDGAEKTAALVVSVAWFESRFRPDAEGDHVRRADGSLDKSRPQSFCAMQIHASNFSGLGVTRESLRSIDTCIATGLRMMSISFGVCRERPLESRLDHYAVGGEGCTKPPRDEGGHRIRKGMWLFRELPPPRTELASRLPG